MFNVSENSEVQVFLFDRSLARALVNHSTTDDDDNNSEIDQ